MPTPFTERSIRGAGLRFRKLALPLFAALLIGIAVPLLYFDDFTPRAILNWRYAKDLMAYASVAKGTKAGDYLAHYAEHFQTVEVDGSYYRAPSPPDCQRWASVTPDGFLFALKVPKLIVHGGEPRDRNLVDENIWNWDKVGRAAEAFASATEELGEKRGPVLLQCPRYPKRLFKTGADFLDACLPFLERIPGPQYVLEVRNGEWLTPDFILTASNAGLSVAMTDFRGPDGFERKTFPHVDDFWGQEQTCSGGGIGYVRLIGDRYEIERITTTWEEQVVPRESELAQWAKAMKELAASSGMDVFAYINNHYAGHGPETASQLIKLLNA